MAVAKVKPVVKRAAKKPVELPVLEFEADLHKTTPGAFQLREDVALEGEEQVSGGIYVRKAHLGGITPKRIRVTIEVLEVED